MYKGEGKKKGCYTLPGRGRGGRHVQKIVTCTRERGACTRESEKEGDMFGEEGKMRGQIQRGRGIGACLQRGGTF